MMPKHHSSSSFVLAQSSIGSEQRIWFLAEANGASHLMQFKDGAWAIRTLDWPVAAICGRADGSSYEVFGVGIHGEICHGSPGRFADTELTIISESSATKGVLRDIRFAGSDVVAVGMNGQVLVRRDGLWRDVSVDTRHEEGAAGFTTVAGASGDDFFVAVMNGRIAYFHRAMWRPVVAGTSVALTKIVMLSADRFAACGAAGTLLVGSASSVEPVKNNVTKDNLYGLVLFKGTVYVASLSALYRVAGEGLRAVEYAFAEGSTFGNLEANDQVMYSVGANHIYATENGGDWRLITCRE